MRALAWIGLLMYCTGWCRISTCQAGNAPDSTRIPQLDTALVNLVQIQDEIKDIHPFLRQLRPLAVVENNDLYLFDVDSSHSRYRFLRKDPVPFPMSKGIRASFPLSTNGGKPTCVVSPEVFDDLQGYATIFHEFVHCAQYQNVERELKEKLDVAQQAERGNDYSWELTHSFPYQDSIFIKNYESFLKALGKGDGKGAEESLRILKQHLNKVDYEYMVWEEWKEGFARFIENKIRARLGVPINRGGSERPYDRVTFYYGGEQYINFLVWHDEGLYTDTKALFERMMAGSK